MQFFSQVALAAAFAATVNAHATVTGIWVNDIFQGDGVNKYIRSPPNNNPVVDLSKSDIICNANNRPVAGKVKVLPGDKVDFEWMHNSRGDDIIDPSHKGPITVYIAPIVSNGQGNVWTKLTEEGFANGQWAVTKLIANRGKHSVNLPANLKAGDYLLRAEILALHSAQVLFTANPTMGAQFYPSCVQISVGGSGNVAPAGKFGFVGGYSYKDPGIDFNIYNDDASTYKISGPPIGSFSGPSATTAPLPPSSSPLPSGKNGGNPFRGPTRSYPAGGLAPIPNSTLRPTNSPASPSNSPVDCVEVPRYSQCGGLLYTGSTKCVKGTTCVRSDDYYSQCR